MWYVIFVLLFLPAVLTVVFAIIFFIIHLFLTIINAIVLLIDMCLVRYISNDEKDESLITLGVIEIIGSGENGDVSNIIDLAIDEYRKVNNRRQ